MTLPYNRALKESDYQELAPYVASLAAFEVRMHGVNYRKDHKHREWEYASILQELVDLSITPPAKILDTGSGASYFPLYLRTLGYDITVNDSMAYGDTTQWLIAQCHHLGIEVPLNASSIEALTLPDNTFDVTMCISVIEHLPVEGFAQSLRELWRVTKPGGYLFITSDYFKDEPSALLSPSLGIQHNRFYPHTTEAMINENIKVEWIGGIDLTYVEPGLVNGHSFVNLCLRKPL